MTTFLNNIDIDKVNELMGETQTNVEYFEKITEKVVLSYSGSLDKLMKDIYNDVLMKDQAPLNTLEKYFLELSNCLYYMGDKLEHLGVYDVMSKNAYKEVYNKKYLGLTDIGESKKKPTVAELTAMAESEAQYEGIVNDVYAKAYKIVKNKVDAATTMLNSISKIISKRMTEMQLNSVTPSGKQILNESYEFPQKIGEYIAPVQGSGKAYVREDGSYCVENDIYRRPF